MLFPLSLFSEMGELLWLKFPQNIQPAADAQHRKFEPKQQMYKELKTGFRMGSELP